MATNRETNKKWFNFPQHKWNHVNWRYQWWSHMAVCTKKQNWNISHSDTEDVLLQRDPAAKWRSSLRPNQLRCGSSNTCVCMGEGGGSWKRCGSLWCVCVCVCVCAVEFSKWEMISFTLQNDTYLVLCEVNYSEDVLSGALVNLCGTKNIVKSAVSSRTSHRIRKNSQEIEKKTFKGKKPLREQQRRIPLAGWREVLSVS